MLQVTALNDSPEDFILQMQIIECPCPQLTVTVIITVADEVWLSRKKHSTIEKQNDCALSTGNNILHFKCDSRFSIEYDRKYNVII